jgi:hypothetical protein
MFNYIRKIKKLKLKTAPKLLTEELDLNLHLHKSQVFFFFVVFVFFSFRGHVTMLLANKKILMLTITGVCKSIAFGLFWSNLIIKACFMF